MSRSLLIPDGRHGRAARGITDDVAVCRGAIRLSLALVSLGAKTRVIGDAVTTHHFSAAHPSAETKAFTAAFEKTAGMRPDFLAVGGYDVMHVIYGALICRSGRDEGARILQRLAAQQAADMVGAKGGVARCIGLQSSVGLRGHWA